MGVHSTKPLSPAQIGARLTWQLKGDLKNAQIAFLAALQSAALPIASYELSLALGVALSTPDAETRWLAGENIFAGLPVAAELPQAYRDQVTKVAQLLAG